MLQEILITYMKALTVDATPLIKTRTCHLITYVYEYIFKAPDQYQYLLGYTQFLITCLEPADADEHVESLQACEAFKAILMHNNKEKDKIQGKLLDELMGTILDTLLHKILTITYEPFFEILMTISRSYCDSVCTSPERLFRLTNL